jgi:hypothetical protein
MSRAERWLTTIPGLSGHRLQVAYARSELYGPSLVELVAALNDVSQLAEEAHAVAREVLTAFVPVVADPQHVARVWSLRATAMAASLPAVGRLLRSSTPDGHLLDAAGLDGSSSVLTRADGRPLTLGERRALARQPSRANLDRLLRDPHPMVVRLLLANPRITERDVVWVAARRPALPAIVAEIAKAWTSSARVRMAVVLNPGSPPAISVPLLALLLRPELAEVGRAADLGAVVRATARERLELRPPLSSVEEPAVKH